MIRGCKYQKSKFTHEPKSQQGVEVDVKENAYLLNCRNSICEALKVLDSAPVPVDVLSARRDMIFAIHELDAFRHGKLQKCDKCSDMNEPENHP